MMKPGYQRRGELFPAPSVPFERTTTIKAIRHLDPQFNMIATRFLVPETGNDGLPFGNSHWTWLHDGIAAITGGGWSIEGYTDGNWRMTDGSNVADHSRRYLVACEHDKLPALYDLISRVKTMFAQEAIYVEQNGKVALV